MAKVAIILTQQFSDWEYGIIAGAGGPFYGIDARFFAPEAGEVRSMGGLVAMVPHGLDEITGWSPEIIVVIGGMLWETEDAPDIAGLLNAHHTAGGVVAGICGGTLALARSGLLDNARHTSNDADFLVNNAKGYSGAARFQASATAVSDNRIITAPGTAPTTFAAAIFESAGAAPEAVQQLKDMLSAEHK